MTLDTLPYMTFCDADPKRSLADKLALVVAAYRRRYHVPPRRCLVRAGQWPELPETIGGVIMQEADHVAAHHFKLPPPEVDDEGVWVCRECGTMWSIAYAWCAACGNGFDGRDEG